MTPEQIEQLRTRAGHITIDCKLTAFLYDLMRDHVPPGIVEGLMVELPSEPVLYTNGWLAQYASDLATRLKKPNDKEPKLNISDVYKLMEEECPKMKAELNQIDAEWHLEPEEMKF